MKVEGSANLPPSTFNLEPATPPSLYLHIPFCQRKCPYCDFNTYAGRETRYAAFAAALTVDLQRTGLAYSRPVAPTVFLGGGTPTVLDPEHLQQIFAGLHDGFDVVAGSEITSEANPGTVDQERFEALQRLGVNRLSMGVQSFAESELHFLGRIHTSQEAAQAFALARRVGFQNINLDFIFGLPGQKLETWAATLDRAIDLDPEHLSLYALTVEDGTPLASWVTNGVVAAPDPDLAADLYELAAVKLAAAGYHQYEISNWARGPLAADGFPRYACRHNLVYWRNEPYLGFGPGAHSSYDHRRWSIVRGVEAYIRGVNAGAPAHDLDEDISPALEMGETMMLGLRLVQVGVSRQGFRQRFGTDVADVYAVELERLQKRGLLEVTADYVRLTPAARLLGNQVFAAFLPEPAP